MSRARTFAGAVAAVLLLAGCGGDSDDGERPGAAAGGGPEVVLKDIAFKPDKITVKVGETVTWKFEDKGIPHDVKAADKSFESEIKDSGTFEHTFEKPGTVTYVCTLHPTMKASVEVTP